ncbi:MAG: CvpA family protein [Clostridiales bacterium]|nr:CvpA family protein [Clostridiales bacterium]
METTIWISLALDLIVVLLLAGGILLGYHKGFMKTIYQLFSWVAAIFLTQLLYPYMVRILKASPVYTSIAKTLRGVLSIPDLNGDAVKTISSLKIPEVLKLKLIENNNYEVYRILGAETLNEYINAYLTNMVVNALGILVTFLIVFLLIKIAAILLEIADHLPVIRQLNHTLGVILGAANGVLYVWIFCLLITLSGAVTKLSFLYPAISSSLLTHWFYNHNILLDSLLRIFGA